MSGTIESVGSIGLNNHRSDMRSVYTLEGKPSPRDIWRAAALLRHDARDVGNTRAQLKFSGSLDMIPPSAEHLVDAVFNPSVGFDNQPSQSGVIFMSANAAERIDSTVQNQWDTARRVWRMPIHITPQERLTRLQDGGYSTDTTLNLSDIQPLFDAWKPFGWTIEGVKQFIETYDPLDSAKAGWFACARKHDGTLCSAAKAEGLTIGGIQIVETTEWGTTSAERGKGLGTGAVIALNQTILQRPPNSPYVIMAEANLAPDLPGHRVARDAGFVPAGADMASPTPNYVLMAHVSIDGQLRNFLPVQLTPHAVATLYSRI